MEPRLHHQLIRLAALHQKRSVAGFAELGLSPGQPRLLEHLSRMDGCIQKDLAASCGIESPTLSKILDGMEASGLIERREAIAHSGKRAVRVRLTETGRAMVPRVAKVLEQVEIACLAGFSVEEKTALLELMGRAGANLVASMEE